MITQLLSKLKTALFLTSFYLVGCSKNIENLPLNEKAIYVSSRYSDDIRADQYRTPLKILDFISLSPGMKIVDLLAGGGYYTELFSYIAGAEGQVYLQNNSLFLRFSEKEIESRLKNNRLKNVIRLDSEYTDLKLPNDVDVIFLGLSFHDFFVQRKDPTITAIPADFYRQVKASLKPNGILIIIDHSANLNTGITETSRLHRIDADWVKKDLNSNGFKFMDSIDVLSNPEDDLNLDIWKKKVFHKTDRFVHKYQLIDNKN